MTRLIDGEASHLEAILAIVNDVIATTTAIYEEQPMTASEATAWWESQQASEHPIVVAVDDEGVVAGFATYGAFNKRSGYRRTIEHSLHVAAAFRGRGLGKRLLAEIEARARAAGMHTMIGLIDAENAASVRLHESAGFHHAGTLRQVGRKHGRWLDMLSYQKLLSDAS